MSRPCTHIQNLNFPWSKTLHHAQLRIETKKAPSVDPIETGNRREKSASTRQAAKGRGSEKVAITHWPCWLEREPVATLQKKHQEQTDQVQ